MPDKQKFYVTTAIFYPNGAPHIGHAYEAIATDAIARFQRLEGNDVLFLTGTDEHGQKMLQTATAKGMTAPDFADAQVPLFRDMVAALECSNDDFIRTTEPRHHKAVSEIWQRMQASGDIYLDKYAGWYSVRDEAYYAESETKLGQGGKRFGPQGTVVEWVEEETYFFRLSAYQDKLLAHYESQPDFILPPERRNEVVSFVRGGLQDLSLSRTTFDWGVPVPGAPGHVMYVWVDALTNYLTGAGYPDIETDKFKRFWPADLHIIGKDILRFHAVYWPAFLMSAGVALPGRVFAHGFLFHRGEKMSKSTGNVIDPIAMARDYGVDQMRYYFLREVPFGKDGSYSHEAIATRINADLANDFGNLAQRSLSMIGKFCAGIVPSPGDFSDEDQTMLNQVDAALGKARAAMAVQAIHTYLGHIWEVVAQANRYFASQQPWALRTTEPERMATVLYVTAEVVRQLAILASPVVPGASARLLDQLGQAANARDFAALGDGGRLARGLNLPAPQPVFPRYVEPESRDND